MIIGERVKEARELAGLSQQVLANRVGVDRSAIAHVEAGAWQPRPELAEALARELGFPPEFFEEESSVDFPLGSLLFRAKATMTALEKAQAHRYGQLMYRKTRHLIEGLRVPSVVIPRLSGLSPEAAAAHTRAALGLSPDTPIKHLINVVERAGVLVLAIPLQLERREAFSAWVGDEALKPVIVVIGSPPGDRLRFSVAHELGHLVMGDREATGLRAIEDAANEFAGYLLMPRGAAETAITEPVTLSSIAPLKPKWGMSIQALVSHAARVGRITRRRERYLYQQIGARGWRFGEPEALAVPVEKPRAIRKVMEHVFGSPIDYRRAAQDLHMYPHQLRALVEPYALRSELPRTTATEMPPANVVPIGRARSATT